MNKSNHLHSVHFTQMSTPLQLLENICNQLRLIWKDSDILIWKIMKAAEGHYLRQVTNDASSSLCADSIDILKVQLEDCFKVTTEAPFRITFNPQAPYAAAVQIKLTGQQGLAPALGDAGIPNETSMEQSIIEQSYLLSITRNKDAEQPFETFDRAVLNLCMQQLLYFNQLYACLLQNNLLLKKFRHDFRTPLTSVSMIGGILESDEKEDLKQMGQMLHAATEKLDQLLKDFKIELEE